MSKTKVGEAGAVAVESGPFEILTSGELAKRWNVPESWVREYCRRERHPTDFIPHIKLGRYIRFHWDSPELRKWWHERKAK